MRNVAKTAPYMHDGQLAMLRDMLRHYATLNLDRLHADGDAILQPLRLTAAETRDLLGFLHSVSATDATRWQADPLPGCRPSRVVGDLDIR